MVSVSIRKIETGNLGFTYNLLACLSYWSHPSLPIQDYGAKVNFKKKKVKLGVFTGLPAYSQYLVERLQNKLKQKNPESADFHPVELCNLEYVPDRGSAIVPHWDDRWLWGDRLVLLNLLSDTGMPVTRPSYTSDTERDSREEWKKYHAFSASVLPEDNVNLRCICWLDLVICTLIYLRILFFRDRTTRAFASLWNGEVLSWLKVQHGTFGNTK